MPMLKSAKSPVLMVMKHANPPARMRRNPSKRMLGRRLRVTMANARKTASAATQALKLVMLHKWIRKFRMS